LIVGTGIDIVEIGRLRRALQRWPRLSGRLFTAAELEYCSPSPLKFARLAGRFAAKEAVAKALGHSLSWRDVEIVNDENGKPIVKVVSDGPAAGQDLQVIVSISHGREYAVAHALAMKKEGVGGAGGKRGSASLTTLSTSKGGEQP